MPLSFFRVLSTIICSIMLCFKVIFINSFLYGYKSSIIYVQTLIQHTYIHIHTHKHIYIHTQVLVIKLNEGWTTETWNKKNIIKLRKRGKRLARAKMKKHLQILFCRCNFKSAEIIYIILNLKKLFEKTITVFQRQNKTGS